MKRVLLCSGCSASSSGATAKSEHVVDMGSYLYPESDTYRLAATAKLYLVDWYINDTIGRDKVNGLNDPARRAAADLAKQLIATSRRAPGEQYFTVVRLLDDRMGQPSANDGQRRQRASARACLG